MVQNGRPHAYKCIIPDCSSVDGYIVAYGYMVAYFNKKVDPEQAKELNQKIAHNYLMYSSWYKE